MENVVKIVAHIARFGKENNWDPTGGNPTCREGVLPKGERIKKKGEGWSFCFFFFFVRGS